MQVVAYGAMDVHFHSYGNYGDTIGTTFNYGKKSKTQFFYEKIKNKKHTITKSIKNSWQFLKPKPKPIDNYHVNGEKEKKKLNMYQLANKNFGGATIRKFNIHLKKKNDSSQHQI